MAFSRNKIQFDRPHMQKPRGDTKALARVAPRVLELARPETKTLTLGLIALALASGMNLLFPYLIQRILNGDIGLVLSEHLAKITGLLLALFLLQAALFYMRSYYFQIAGHRIVTAVRNLLYTSMVRQDIAFFDSARVGDLVSRLTADTQLVQRAVTINISVALRYILQVVGATALMCLISWRLTLVTLLVIPSMILLSIGWGKTLRKLSKRLQVELGEATVIAEETLGSIRTVKLFAGSDYESARHEKAMSRALEVGIERSAVSAVFTSAMVFLMNASIALVVWYGGSQVINSQMSLGDLTAFILYCVIAAISIGFLANVWDEFMQAVGAGERIFEIVDKQPLITNSTHPQDPPQVSAGRIVFDDVSFAYPSRPEKNVLEHVSLEIPEGKTIALVGPSGSGKSTVAALISRFYDPTAGNIYYCGIPLTVLSLEKLREQISLVPQDPQVFSVSVGENIAYGEITASREEVIAAAKAANIHAFIESLPQGYDTLVGDRGVQLSGGQRQRVAIARAILKNPKFLILDEATSALDSENEQLIHQALERLMHGRTTLVIAHRLSTVKHADQVLVLQEGRLIQHGTHESLMTQGGLYRNLVELQLLSA